MFFLGQHSRIYELLFQRNTLIGKFFMYIFMYIFRWFSCKLLIYMYGSMPAVAPIASFKQCNKVR